MQGLGVGHATMESIRRTAWLHHPRQFHPVGPSQAELRMLSQVLPHRRCEPIQAIRRDRAPCVRGGVQSQTVPACCPRCCRCVTVSPSRPPEQTGPYVHLEGCRAELGVEAVAHESPWLPRRTMDLTLWVGKGRRT